MKILIHVLVSALAVYITARICPGVYVDGFGSALVAAVVLGLVNGFIRPLLLILTLPINVVTLWLFTFVVIGFCVEIVSMIVPGFKVAGIFWAMMFALVLSVVSAFLHSLERKS